MIGDVAGVTPRLDARLIMDTLDVLRSKDDDDGSEATVRLKAAVIDEDPVAISANDPAASVSPTIAMSGFVPTTF